MGVEAAALFLNDEGGPPAPGFLPTDPAPTPVEPARLILLAAGDPSPGARFSDDSLPSPDELAVDARGGGRVFAREDAVGAKSREVEAEGVVVWREGEAWLKMVEAGRREGVVAVEVVAEGTRGGWEERRGVRF